MPFDQTGPSSRPGQHLAGSGGVNLEPPIPLLEQLVTGIARPN